MTAVRSSLEVRPRGDLPPALRPPLLAGGPRPLAELETAAASTPGGAVGLHRALHGDADAGLITFATGPGPGCLAELRPMAPGFRLAPLPSGRVALSRFAHVRREGAGLCLETPLGVGTITLRGEAVGCLDALARGVEVEELIAASGRPQELLALLELCVSNLAASPVRQTGEARVDGSEALAQWEFHDLLLHWRSRVGAHDGEIGGTYRFAGRLEPTPWRVPDARRSIPLPRPVAAIPAGATLHRVLDERRSVREHGAVPISVAELGAFLFHSARVREVVPGEAWLGPSSRRPYPSAGAVYELELYLVVDRCAGLAPGFYRYDALEHGLVPIAAPGADTEAMLAAATAANGAGCRPQVLLAISSRFGRVAFKYAGIAYALTLKNLGALYATMYLVATALGLAPCALGVGDSRRFARLAGVDPYVEAGIGEFMLGSRP
jgi:SagB-type dehydrogenase family enzyme